MLGVGAETTLANGHGLLVLRMRPKGAHRGELFRQHIDGTIEADRQHVVVLVERGEHAGHLHVRPKAADAGLDRLLQFRMDTDDARQRQQSQR